MRSNCLCAGFEHLHSGAYRLAIQQEAEADGSAAGRLGGAPPATGVPPDLTAYVMSPKDIVAARSRDWDDRLSWLLQRNLFQEALALARRHHAHLVRHRLADVAELYLAHMLHCQKEAQVPPTLPLRFPAFSSSSTRLPPPQTAAELCSELLDDNPNLWQKWAMRVHCFLLLSLYFDLLPPGGCKSSQRSTRSPS